MSKAGRGRVEAVGEIARVLDNTTVAAEGYFRLDLDAPSIVGEVHDGLIRVHAHVMGQVGSDATQRRIGLRVGSEQPAAAKDFARQQSVGGNHLGVTSIRREIRIGTEFSENIPACPFRRDVEFGCRQGDPSGVPGLRRRRRDLGGMGRPNEQTRPTETNQAD